MKIIHVGIYNPSPVGGVGKTILEHTTRLHQSGHEVEIWKFSPGLQTPCRMECDAPFPVWELPMHAGPVSRFAGLPEPCRKWIAENIPAIDIFHIHSVFIPENYHITRLGKPYVMTPNGGWSLSVLNGRKRLLKRIWMLLREKPMWKSAAAIQAVSREEARQLVRLPGMAPVRYIPNGTRLPEKPSPAPERDAYLYIGRYDINQKGLDFLMQAIAAIKQRNVVIPKLIMAGPDYRGGRAQLESFISSHGLSEMIELMGPVQGEDKEQLFRRARLFIHTSRWEGLPLVLLEALAYGVPCLLTPGTNVSSEWAAAGCAFETSTDPNEIADHLIHLSTQLLEKESRQARALAESDYSWASIVEKLSILYTTSIRTNQPKPTLPNVPS